MRRALVGSGQLSIPLPPSLTVVRQRPTPQPAARPARQGPRSRRLVLEVERVSSPHRGTGYRLRAPRALGWAAVAYTPQELARALHDGWTEAEIAGYARWRGSSYDTPEAMEQGHRPVPPRAPVTAAQRAEDAQRPRSVLPPGQPWGSNRRLLRPDTADPADWTILPNGRLQAPARSDGKPPLTYGRDTTMGRRILERRAAAGLPTAA